MINIWKMKSFYQYFPHLIFDNLTLLQVPRLRDYIPYCSNQVYAKALLDVKKQDPQVEDFLQRCQDSPFSRRLDLWSFLGKL